VETKTAAVAVLASVVAGDCIVGGGAWVRELCADVLKDA
jgi:hypothetical protein